MEALGEVLLNLDQRALNRALKALNPGRTVTFHHDALQAEEACAVMSRRREIRLQTLHQWQGQSTHHAGSEALLEQGLDTRGDHRRQAFAGLEQDIADKTVTDHHIRLAAIQAIALDKTDVWMPRAACNKVAANLTC